MGELLSLTYTVRDVPERGLAAVDLAARRGADWFLARKWVRTHGGARALYRFLDRVEMHGFRFAVKRGPAPQPTGPGWPAERQFDPCGASAAQLHAQLTAEERQIHRELFPEEARLLECGYDWDSAGAYRHGSPIPQDDAGRRLETDAGTLYEWVRVPEEYTWRRYPLERLAPQVAQQ